MSLKVGDRYILTTNGAINSHPMKLIKITDTDCFFMDGMSPWGGAKQDIEKMVEKGELVRLDHLEKGGLESDRKN